MSTAVADARKTQTGEIMRQIEKALPQFALVMPKGMDPDRFIRIVQTALNTNPSLAECEVRSVLAACMRLATDGYDPDGVRAALVPFKDKHGNKLVSPIKMIAGLREKVRESGEVSDWRCEPVCANDVFAYRLGDDPHIVHEPSLNDRGAIIAAYSIVTFRDGSKSRDVMGIEAINKRKAVAKTQGIWDAWPEEMACKTVGKHHAKQLPTSNTIETFFRDDDIDVPDTRPVLASSSPTKLPGRHLERTAPASDAAADEGRLDDTPANTLGGEADAGADAEPFAVHVTRHAQALAAAAKDGPLALSSAWARVPETFKDSLRGNYEELTKNGVANG